MHVNSTGSLISSITFFNSAIKFANNCIILRSLTLLQSSYNLSFRHNRKGTVVLLQIQITIKMTKVNVHKGFYKAKNNTLVSRNAGDEKNLHLGGRFYQFN